MWFEEHLKTLEEPSLEQKVWCQHPKKLTVLFVEGDRKPCTKYNIWNIAHVYGGTDVGLHIICSPRNINDFKEWTKDWTNVVITWAPLNSIKEYSEFIASPDFHHRFVSTHILLMQWDSYIFKKVDDHFFDYDYVGAPWEGCVVGYDARQIRIEHIGNRKHWRVGNGGFSLRNIMSCYAHCIENADKPRDVEDVFFAISNLKIPPKEIAYEFSVEARLDDVVMKKSPVGMHKIWNFQYGESDFKKWCNLTI